MEAKEKIFDSLKLSSISIKKISYGYHSIQTNYTSTMKEIARDAIYNEFKTARHKLELEWISITRPVICALANMMSQTIEDFFTHKYVVMVNRAIRKLLKTRTFGLRYHALGSDSLRMILISDGSFANNPDLSSQLKDIILLTGKINKSYILSYASCESKRIVCSVLGAETYALADCFDSAFTL